MVSCKTDIYHIHTYREEETKTNLTFNTPCSSTSFLPKKKRKRKKVLEFVTGEHALAQLSLVEAEAWEYSLQLLHPGIFDGALQLLILVHVAKYGKAQCLLPFCVDECMIATQPGKIGQLDFGGMEDVFFFPDRIFLMSGFHSEDWMVLV